MQRVVKLGFTVSPNDAWLDGSARARCRYQSSPQRGSHRRGGSDAVLSHLGHTEPASVDLMHARDLLLVLILLAGSGTYKSHSFVLVARKQKNKIQVSW